MTPQELDAQLAVLLQSLPADLRAALEAPSNPVPADESELPMEVRAAQKAMLAAGETPGESLLKIVNALLHQFIQRANPVLQGAFRTAPVNLFGDAGNRLDPLQFHDHVTARASGEVCLPQSCTDMGFLGRWCFPPVALCAGGGASAGLTRLHGLSSVRIASVWVTNVPKPNGASLTVNGLLELRTDSVSASGFAEAHGGPFGINLPVAASGSGTVHSVRMRGDVSVTIDLQALKITRIRLHNFALRYSAVEIHVSGLGVFNYLLGPLVDGVKAILEPVFSVEGALSRALRGVVQSQLDALV